MNGVFAEKGVIIVELKTLYGYDTDIFARVADARGGVYVHIDVRSYSVAKVWHVADEFLADRIIAGIRAAVNLQKEGSPAVLRNISAVHQDYMLGPSVATGDLKHLLGPPADTIHQTCDNQLLYSTFREKVLKGVRYQYCNQCGEFG